MDRDEVNFIHHLYQSARGAKYDDFPLWSPDTFDALEGRAFVDKRGDLYHLPAGYHSFIKEVENQMNRLPDRTFLFGYPISDPVRKVGDARAAFLAIPYARVFDKVKRRVLGAAEAAGFECEVTGDLRKAGSIMDQVWQGIRRSEIMVADITGANPNVMIEVGMAAALGKDVLILTQDRRVPFDIRHWRVIRYKSDGMDRLETELARAFVDAEARYPDDRGRYPG